MLQLLFAKRDASTEVFWLDSLFQWNNPLKLDWYTLMVFFSNYNQQRVQYNSF